MKRLPALLLCATAVLTLGVGAGAQVGQTFLSFVSDPGDYIGQGQTRFFTPDTATFQSRTDGNNRHINVTIFPFDGGFWILDMAAPEGQQLLPAVYEGAVRWPFQAPNQPGLSISGDGRGCNTLTGRFQVMEAVYGPFGYVERFRASFEQHCEGATAALRGDIQIVNPPPPPPLVLTVNVNASGSVNRIAGTATVRGTIACSVATTANLFGILRQRASRFLLSSGSFGLTIDCTPTPRPWSAEVSSEPGPPFNAGHAQLDLSADAFDPNYGAFVTKEVRAVVRLTGAR